MVVQRKKYVTIAFRTYIVFRFHVAVANAIFVTANTDTETGSKSTKTHSTGDDTASTNTDTETGSKSTKTHSTGDDTAPTNTETGGNTTAIFDTNGCTYHATASCHEDATCIDTDLENNLWECVCPQGMEGDGLKGDDHTGCGGKESIFTCSVYIPYLVISLLKYSIVQFDIQFL